MTDWIVRAQQGLRPRAAVAAVRASIGSIGSIGSTTDQAVLASNGSIGSRSHKGFSTSLSLSLDQCSETPCDFQIPIGQGAAIAAVRKHQATPPAVAQEVEAIRELFVAAGRIFVGLAVMSRSEAVLEAGSIAGTLARNRGYMWASLRTALEGYPELLVMVPDRDGPVDALPLGVARHAVLKDGRVVRQGEFSEVHEVRA
jgi:hypothetical protein